MSTATIRTGDVEWRAPETVATVEAEGFVVHRNADRVVVYGRHQLWHVSYDQPNQWTLADGSGLLKRVPRSVQMLATAFAKAGHGGGV